MINIILCLSLILVFLSSSMVISTNFPPRKLKVEMTHVLQDEYVKNSVFGLRGLALGGNFKKREKILPLFKEAGIRWHRSALFWYQVEPQNGKFDFSEYDRLYQQLKKYNIEIIFTIRCVSPWGAKKSKLAVKFEGIDDLTREVSDMPDNMEDYIDFVSKTVSHFKGKIRFWRIESEPTLRGNFWGGTAEELAELTKVAYKTIKKVDPKAQVLLSGFTTRSLLTKEESEFIETMFKKGVGDYFDIFDIHSYTAPQRVFRTVEAVKKILERYGYTGNKSKPIWMTETSTPGAEPLFPLSEQANDVIKRFTLAFSAGISRVCWWDAVDSGKPPINSEKERYKYYGLLSEDLKPKPAWSAYKLMTQKLRGFRKIEKLDAGTGAFVFKYSWDNGSSLYVAWGKKKRGVELESQKDKVRITQLNGKVREVKVYARKFTIELNRSPVFIEYGTKLE